MVVRHCKCDITLDLELRILGGRYARFELDADDEAHHFREGFIGNLWNTELAG